VFNPAPRASYITFEDIKKRVNKDVDESRVSQKSDSIRQRSNDHSLPGKIKETRTVITPKEPFIADLWAGTMQKLQMCPSN
jgi:hypothetical protein